MVGGLHPTLKGEWYLELVRALRALDPNFFVKAFTAVEIRHLAFRIFKKSIRETLEMLREAGLCAITGGGAEIFDQSVRDPGVPGQRKRGGMVGGTPDVASDGDAEHVDDALRAHRDGRATRGSFAIPADVAG